MSPRGAGVRWNSFIFMIDVYYRVHITWCCSGVSRNSHKYIHEHKNYASNALFSSRSHPLLVIFWCCLLLYRCAPVTGTPLVYLFFKLYCCLWVAPYSKLCNHERLELLRCWGILRAPEHLRLDQATDGVSAFAPCPRVGFLDALSSLAPSSASHHPLRWVAHRLHERRAVDNSRARPSTRCMARATRSSAPSPRTATARRAGARAARTSSAPRVGHFLKRIVIFFKKCEFIHLVFCCGVQRLCTVLRSRIQR